MSQTAGGRGVLEGAFALLEALNAHDGRQTGLTQLVQASGLPKTTAHRLLDQLVDLGAVERSAGRYRIGSRVFRLGQAWQPGLRELATDRLPALSARLRASLVLAVSLERRVLVASAALLPGAPGGVRPGTILPSGTAAAHLLAAHDPTRQEPAADEIRAGGFAVETETVAPGVSCIAVPIRFPHGVVAATLAAVLPASRSPLSLVDVLTSTAHGFGAALVSAQRDA